MYLRLELFGLFLELGALDASEPDEPEAEQFAISDGAAPGPVDAYDEPDLPDEHQMPVGFHVREVGPEDV